MFPGRNQLARCEEGWNLHFGHLGILVSPKGLLCVFSHPNIIPSSGSPFARFGPRFGARHGRVVLRVAFTGWAQGKPNGKSTLPP